MSNSNTVPQRATIVVDYAVNPEFYPDHIDTPKEIAEFDQDFFEHDPAHLLHLVENNAFTITIEPQ